mgnify:FL=1
MAQVAVTNRALHLDSWITKEIVDGSLYVLRLGGVIEGGPSASRIEFFLGREKLGITTRAEVGPGSLLFKFPVDFTVGAFRSRLPENPVLLWRKLLPPLFGGFGYLLRSLLHWLFMWF